MSAPVLRRDDNAESTGEVAHRYKCTCIPRGDDGLLLQWRWVNEPISLEPAADGASERGGLGVVGRDGGEVMAGGAAVPPTTQ